MRRLHGLLLLASLVFSVPVHAQDWRTGTGRLEGKVMSREGEPLADVIVKLELPGRGGTELKTDKRGRWAILGLSGGDWAVEFSADGYVSQRLTLAVAELSRRPVVEVRLEAARPKGPPAEVAAALTEAEAAYRSGRFAEARRGYEKLLALRPDLAGSILQQIGFSYIQEKDYKKGLEALLEALAADPENVNARVAAVQAAFEAGQPEKGRELLAAVDASRIDNPDIFFNFGIGLLNADAPREAIAYFDRAVALDPEYVDGYYRRGLAHLQLGDSAECRADLQKVVAISPGTALGETARTILETIP